jgi:RimJ/RimL family protein N-acetyltransferase
MADFRLETERLTIRSWRDDDLDPFAAMCADPRVMATLGPVMDRDATAALIARVNAIEAEHGMTFWALERKADAAFIGWCGLIVGDAETPIVGKPEIGWRLAFDAWGQGYAREAAEATLAWGFGQKGLDRIWAITSVGNKNSWGLMERLGMVRHHDLDFDHPHVAADSSLRPHVTYSIQR